MKGKTLEERILIPGGEENLSYKLGSFRSFEFELNTYRFTISCEGKFHFASINSVDMLEAEKSHVFVCLEEFFYLSKAIDKSCLSFNNRSSLVDEKFTQKTLSNETRLLT